MDPIASICPVQPDDVERVFGWRNDPFILARSSSRKTVTWEEHRTWFAAALKRDDLLMFIIRAGAEPAGLLRFAREADGKSCIVSVYLLEPFVGRGLGRAALSAGCAEVWRGWPAVQEIIACVRTDNAAAQRAFRRAGFLDLEHTDRCPDGHLAFGRGREIGGADRAHRERTIRFYEEQAAAHGVGHRALGWGSREGQELRFKVLNEVGIRTGDSVLDVGCGQGDFLAWLRSQPSEVSYTGLDVTARLLDTARGRFPGARFLEGDFLETAVEQHDWVVASGIFAHAAAEPLAYAERGISRLYALARRGVACNFLHARAAEKAEGEFYADPEELLRFCRSLTPWVALREDYHARDFTLYLYRERQT